MGKLFAKINPAAQIPQMSSPFEFNVDVADYVTARVNNYDLGASLVSFEVNIGIPTFDAENKLISFKSVLIDIVNITAPDLDSWGTDDSYILGKICELLGTQAVEFIELNVHSN